MPIKGLNRSTPNAVQLINSVAQIGSFTTHVVGSFTINISIAKYPCPQKNGLELSTYVKTDHHTCWSNIDE